jgi:hypothetical protein
MESISTSSVTTTNDPNAVSNGDDSSSASHSENATQKLIRENVKHLIEQLEAGHSETLTAYLRAMAVFKDYSFGNQLAIARQRPSAIHVAGMFAWNKLGRFVNRGEKGIAILAPVIGKSRKQRESPNDADKDTKAPVLLGFRRVYVWSEDQTHGLPLPELEKVTGDAGAYLDRLRDFVNAQGITLEYTESIAPALGAAFGTTILLLPGQSKPEELNTLVHEAAHLALKHQDRRATTTKTVRETEAEAVAFVVAQGIGINATQSASYIQLYHGDAALLIESLAAVQQVSAMILSAITVEDSISQDPTGFSPEATEQVEPASAHKQGRRPGRRPRRPEPETSAA